MASSAPVLTDGKGGGSDGGDSSNYSGKGELRAKNVAWAAFANISSSCDNLLPKCADWGRHTVVSGTHGWVEYELESPVAGPATLRIQYNAAESRPLEASMNGKRVGSVAAGVTGTWKDMSKARWDTYGGVTLVKGDNTLRLSTSGCFPHLLAFELCIGSTTWAAHERIVDASANLLPKSNGWSGHTVVDGTGGLVSYSFKAPTASTVKLVIRYNAVDSRPLQLSVNGVTAGAVASGVSGSWNDTSRAIEDTISIAVRTGRNVLKLTTTGYFPHLLRFTVLNK